MTCEILFLCVLTKKTSDCLPIEEGILGRIMAVSKEERLKFFGFDEEEDDPSVSQKALSEEESPVFDKDEKKCLPAEVDEAMGDEIHTMLDKFGDGINNSLLEKRRRMQMYSETVSKESSYKMKQVWETKQQQILEVNKKYYPKFMDLFKQWDLEKQRYEKWQENIIKFFQQQQMKLRDYQMKRYQRMKLIIQLVTQYLQSLENIEDKSNNLSTASLTELKKELAEYQRKCMMETQQQEIANIRKSLQSILYS